MSGKSRCGSCRFFEYDEETGSSCCSQDLDEDETERFLRAAADACPFFSFLGEAVRAAPEELRQREQDR